MPKKGLEYPKNSRQLLKRLEELESELGDKPSEEWDLRRRFHFDVLSLYQSHINMVKSGSTLAEMHPLHLMGMKPPTERDAVHVLEAAAVKKRIALRLRELKAQGRYRPVRISLDW